MELWKIGWGGSVAVALNPEADSIEILFAASRRPPRHWRTCHLCSGLLSLPPALLGEELLLLLLLLLPLFATKRSLQGCATTVESIFQSAETLHKLSFQGGELIQRCCLAASGHCP